MLVGAVLLLLFLLMFSASIGLLVAGLRRSGRGFPSCGRCGYDVRGAEHVQDTCPECGQSLLVAGIVPARSQRRPGLIVAGSALLLVTVGCFSVSTLSLVRASSTRARAIQIQQQQLIQLQRAQQQNMQQAQQQLQQMQQRAATITATASGPTTAPDAPQPNEPDESDEPPTVDAPEE